MKFYSLNRAVRKAEKAAAVVAHNAAHEAKLKRLFPIVRDPNMPAQPVVEKQVGYTKPVPTTLLTAVFFAVVRKALDVSKRYHGYAPAPMGRRAQARAAGYCNYREQLALEAEQRRNAAVSA